MLNMSRLRDSLAEKSWIGFDLDDTLHEFRRASGKAADCALRAISAKHGYELRVLKDKYVEILRERSSNAFSDGKPSHQYRKERFEALLNDYLIRHDDDFLAELCNTYETALMASLELKSGAHSLLRKLKALGKKIVVITEGPHDAQERTIHALGIASCIDYLATSNSFRISKTEGLFPKVLDHLGISAADIAFIGDSDMRPAMAEGIFGVQLAEDKPLGLDLSPPRINTLWKLEDILLDDDLPSRAPNADGASHGSTSLVARDLQRMSRSSRNTHYH